MGLTPAVFFIHRENVALKRPDDFMDFQMINQVSKCPLLFHALNDEVVAFYTKFGFETSAVNALTLLFPVKV